MAFKTFSLGPPSNVEITVYKRRAAHSLRLTIAGSAVRVTIPFWAPYKAGVEYARSRLDWIEREIHPATVLVQQQLVGKHHVLHFVPQTRSIRVASRVFNDRVIVTMPLRTPIDDSEVQTVAAKACIRALRQEAEDLLPPRLAELAKQHGFLYRSVNIKQLKGRWGSCDSHTNIIFNLFLMQLPWQLIDYVILHELTHTRVMRHGPDFWRAMEDVLPNVKVRRASIKREQPILRSVNTG